LEAWLQKQPREVAVAFAARAALRVLPIVQMAQRASYKGDLLSDVVLPVFRATAVSWVAAKYAVHETELAMSARAAARAAALAATAASASEAASDAATVASDAASVASAPASGADTSAAPAFVFASAFLTDVAAANASTTALWSAISLDATRVDEGVEASDIAGSPLWQRQRFHYHSDRQRVVELVKEQPDGLRSLWLELKATLVAANDDWDVWTDWYDDRLDGGPRTEERELAYVRIEEALWNQGPAVVNAEIRKRIENSRSAALAVTEPRDEAALTGVVASTAVPLAATAAAVAGDIVGGGAPPESIPPEPSSEPGPVLQVTERGLEIIWQPIGTDFDETLQKALHERLRHLLLTLKDATSRVANAHPTLDHLVSEYSDLIAQPFDRLDIGSLWAVGTGLLAFRVAFANQFSGTMTEPLEPHHLALLQQAAEIHGGFILGFPKGRELTDRAD